ncbi:Smr/MutS family protein [Sphingomonas sp.]
MARPPRALSPEERALWQRVISSVTPIARAKPVPAPPDVPFAAPVAAPAPDPEPVKRVKGRVPPPRQPAPPPPPKPPRDTLDGGWDRRLSRGLVAPESSIDLHGHTLASAHALLDQGLARAIARGDRVLLLITGKPPRPESERPHARGAIRAAVGDWLAASRHADAIAAVRPAHPRHGGQGALYIILRRFRSPARNF